MQSHKDSVARAFHNPNLLSEHFLAHNITMLIEKKDDYEGDSCGIYSQ